MSDEFECGICGDYVYAPIFRCGHKMHLFCADCQLNLEYGPKATGKCPMCTLDGKFLRDGILERKMAKRLVPCGNAAHGCKKQVYDFDEEHAKVCTYASRACFVCGEMIAGDVSRLYLHYMQKCKKMGCVDVDVSFPRKQIDETMLPYVAIDNEKMLVAIDKVADNKDWLRICVCFDADSKYAQRTVMFTTKNEKGTFSTNFPVSIAPTMKFHAVIPVCMGWSFAIKLLDPTSNQHSIPGYTGGHPFPPVIVESFVIHPPAGVVDDDDDDHNLPDLEEEDEEPNEDDDSSGMEGIEEQSA